MEKKRWSLIFIGLCLALVFSVSPVEAQMHHDCSKCAHCDRDGDGRIKDTPPCINSCEGFPIDLNDREPFDNEPNICTGEDSESFVPVQICHFKNTLKHCEIGGKFVGGGERTVTSQRQLDQHLSEHDDCVNFPDKDDEFFTPQQCPNHCVAVTLEPRCL